MEKYFLKDDLNLICVPAKTFKNQKTTKYQK